MSWRLTLTAPAQIDIADVLNRTLDDFGLRQQQIYQRLIRETLLMLQRDPRSNRSKRRTEFSGEVRSLHLSVAGGRASHALIYRIRGDDHIEVARLFHDAMDIAMHLPDPFVDPN